MIGRALSFLYRLWTASLIVRNFPAPPLIPRLALDLGCLSRPARPEIVQRVLRATVLAQRAQAGAPSPLRPSGSWRWPAEKGRWPYLDAVLRQDAPALGVLLEDCFRNGAVQGLMTHGSFDQVIRLRPWARWRFREGLRFDLAVWRDRFPGEPWTALHTPLIGNPWGIRFGDTLILPTAPRHHATSQQIQTLLPPAGRAVVGEIGGGFGGMASFLLRDRPDTLYLGIDLPEVQLVAAYYLLHAFPERRALLYGERDSEQPLTAAELADYDLILWPPVGILNLPEAAVDVWVNTASLSEMGPETVADYLAQIDRTGRRYVWSDNSVLPVQKGRHDVEFPATAWPIPASWRCLMHGYPFWTSRGFRHREHLYALRKEERECASR